MAPEPNIQAEVLKLARVLGCEPARLSYLEKLAAEDIVQLREQATDMLFSAHDRTLEKLAASSKLLPVALVALIAERAFGPILAARMAGLLEPSRAVAVAERLPTQFLAETASHIDPRRTSQVITGIPPNQIAGITQILVARKDYVTMGRAVGQLSPEALALALDSLSDEDLLRTAFVAEDKERLPELAGLLGHERLVGMIDVAERNGLEDEATDLLGYLDEGQRNEVLAALRERDAAAHGQVLDHLSGAGG